MADNKTQENEGSVIDFINALENQRRKDDAIASLALYEEATGLQAKLWGTSIVGYGRYHYIYESGREGDFMKAGFSPRKTSMTYYIMSGFPDLQNLLKKLGKHKMSKSCLYINKLDDVDKTVLFEIVKKSFQEMNRKYG